MITTKDFYQALLSLLGNNVMDNWFKLFDIKQKDSNTNDANFIIFLPNSFIKDWISTHYIDQIYEVLTKLSMKEKIFICFEVQDLSDRVPMYSSEYSSEILNNQNNSYENKNYAHSASSNYTHSSVNDQLAEFAINNHYTFENFIIGRSNEMAYTAALKMCENAGSTPIFNPLFIYGEPGVGKSHLLFAIINRLLQNKPNFKITYMTAEQFMYAFIKALKENRIMYFKEELRQSKFFLIDDVQFMMGKGSTQEEFFHTFNFLKQEQCQIVLSSDQSPNKLEGLEDRLRSRLGSGLSVEIHEPNYELRLSILNSKVIDEKVIVSDDVLQFLSQNIKGNIRDLEGAWTRLVTYSRWMKEPITLDLVNQILHDSLASYERKITLPDIQIHICQFFNIDLKDLKADKREKKLTKARHIAMFLCRELTNASSTDIGMVFGGKDHSSVLYAVDKIAKELKTDFALRHELDLIRKQIKSVF